MKNKIISFLIVAIIGTGLFIASFTQKNYKKANEVYQVYLNGNKIGLITDKDDLYDLIDERQLEIKEKYGVKNVYPPNGFDIVKSYTYNDMVNDVDEIYKQIESVDDFTIKGYTITIHYTKEDEDTGKIPEDLKINVLSKKVFNEAIMNYIYAFVGKDAYNNFINNTQPEIKDVGKKIEKMYFQENITIKENNISVKEKIYTDASELSQFLLFGSDIKEETYTIKSGDNIEKVSEEHKLNSQEFLVANPKYRSENSLLTIGDEVSIALVTQTGVNGITRFTERYKSVNGEAGDTTILNKEVIRETVNQITTKGKKVNYGSIPSQYIDTGGTWAWPTNSGYKITSNYAYRWGKLHAALDIAYLPRRSPAYAAGDGVVVTATRGTGSGWSLGNYVVIKHDNNIYTQYAHLDVISVKEGQTVSKGQVVGGIGDTGRATGVHLHFAAFYGMPYRGGQPFNPMKLYK